MRFIGRLGMSGAPKQDDTTTSGVGECRSWLFTATAYARDFYHATYDVTVDSERFVMIRLSDSGSLDEVLVIVENWFEELRGLVAGGGR